MPFSCAVAGGRPVLTPSQDQGHRIIGARENRPFAACSPANPDFCRKWTVHRFDLDCGGVRVPWTEIVAEAQGDGRAWLENGRLRLRMPPRWNLAPDDPCARGSGDDDRWRYGRLGRYCADRRALAPPSFVEMPVGFAPVFGIDAVFVAATAPRGSAAPPLAAPPVAKPVPPKVVRVETPQGAPPAPRTVPPKDVPVGKQLPPKADTPPVAQSPAPPPAATGPTAPKIINRSEPLPGDAPPVPSPVAEPPKVMAPNPDVPGKRFGAPQVPATTPQPATPPGATETPIQVTLVSLLHSPLVPIVVAMMGLTMLVIAAFSFIRQRERAQLGGMRSRDFASVSLDGASTGRDLVATPRNKVAQPAVAGSPHQQTSSLPMRPAWGETIPRTRSEAFEVLGLGVTPDATVVAIKKIVDGLRLSWHPDHASDPSNRELRELRLKQINAAWEILAGKPVQA